jgi:hypothetical protein
MPSQCAKIRARQQFGVEKSGWKGDSAALLLTPNSRAA